MKGGMWIVEDELSSSKVHSVNEGAFPTGTVIATANGNVNGNVSATVEVSDPDGVVEFPPAYRTEENEL